MKEKLILAAVTLTTTASTFAGAPSDGVGQVPEPSTIGLFIAAAAAITILTKLRK